MAYVPKLTMNVTFKKDFLKRFEGREFKEKITKLHRDLVVQTFEFWKQTAAMRLKSSRTKYINDLSLHFYASGKAEIKMGSFAQLLEKGSPHFDMKAGLLRNRRSKQDRKYKLSKAGVKYRHVLLNTNNDPDFNPQSTNGRWVTVTENSPGWQWAKYRTPYSSQPQVPLRMFRYVADYARDTIRNKLVEDFKRSVKK